MPCSPAEARLATPGPKRRRRKESTDSSSGLEEEEADEADEEEGEGLQRDRNGSKEAERKVDGLIADLNGLRERGWSLLEGERMNRFLADGWVLGMAIMSSFSPRSHIWRQYTVLAVI
jgi:hypothetical protein